MTVDTVLRSLARIPRRQLPPFWPARVTARATDRPPRARAPRVMWIYWTAVVVIGGPFLLTSWERLAAIAAGAAAIRAVIGLTRHQSESSRKAAS
jgi:hypothetical protein